MYDKFCNGSHICPICKLNKKCTGGAFGHDSTVGQGKCHANAKGHECFCEDCQENRWNEVLEWHENNDKIFLSIT